MAESMSRPKDPLALKLKPARYDAQGKLTHKAIWYFRWDGKRIETGCGEAEFEEAQEYLRQFLNQKHIEELKDRDSTRVPVHLFPICDALTLYAEYKAGEIAKRGKDRQLKEFLRRIEKLIDYWGERPVKDIKIETCDEYVEGRKLSMAERELSDLSAAVTWCMEREHIETYAINFRKPSPRKARHAWFTKQQMAKIIRFCWRYQAPYTYTERRSKKSHLLGSTIRTNRYPYRHLIPFILTGIYTGTRSIRILEASYIQKPGRPWIDLERGLFFREADDEFTPDNKLAKPCRIPRKLLSMMRRWHAQGAEDLCAYNDRVAGSNYTAFRTVVAKALQGEKIKDLNRHALRHTCATWLCIEGVDVDKIGRYLSCSGKTIIEHYGHWHPEHGKEIDDVFSTAGNAKKKRSPAPAPVVTPNLMRDLILDYAKVAKVPAAVMSMIYACPDDDLTKLHSKIKACVELEDFSALTKTKEAA